MQDNLFSSIIENEKLVAKYRAAPPNLKAGENSPIFSPPDAFPRPSNNESAHDSAVLHKPILQQNTISYPKYRICIDSVDKMVEGTMLTSTYIVYRIRFTRMSDLQSHATWKRYKEMAAWFAQLGQRYSELANSATVKFPAASDTWMGNQNDPLGEFVMKRKLDLENFLKTLFGEFPMLARNQSIIEFFELSALPPEKMSVVATRIAARELQDAQKQSSHRTIAGLGVGDMKGGVGGEIDTSWYHYDRTVMREILAKETVFDPHRMIMVRKDEGSAQKSGKGCDATVAELMSFNEMHLKMQAARQVQ